MQIRCVKTNFPTYEGVFPPLSGKSMRFYGFINSFFANRQSGKETIEKNGVFLENGEKTISHTNSDSFNGYHEKEQIGRRLCIKYCARN